MMPDAMRSYLLSLLDGDSGRGVYDLCLDHKLIADTHPGKFEHIDGLDLLPDLEVLSIGMHALQAATGLSGLSRLRSLDLSYNDLTDLGEILQLGQLEYLDISHNEVEHLDGIGALTRLTELYAGFNALQSLEPLQESQSLRLLHVNGNALLDSVSGLPAGLRRLYLGKCRIPDLSPLLLLHELVHLVLSPYRPPQLQALSGHPALCELFLQGGSLEGAVTIPHLPRLERLTISKGKQVARLRFEADMPALQHLELEHLPLHTPPILTACEGLETLELLFAPLENLDGLAALPKLKLLRLNGSAIPQQALAALRAQRPDLEIEF